jgi:hypothetical protein
MPRLEEIAEEPTTDSCAPHLAAKMPMNFRCLAWPSQGCWVAECIDLNIVVEAPSRDEAVVSLKDAVMVYLCTAIEGDPKGLVPRLSPLSHRLYYHFLHLRDIFNARFFEPRNGSTGVFQLPIAGHC